MIALCTCSDAGQNKTGLFTRTPVRIELPQGFVVACKEVGDRNALAAGFDFVLAAVVLKRNNAQLSSHSEEAVKQQQVRVLAWGGNLSGQLGVGLHGDDGDAAGLTFHDVSCFFINCLHDEALDQCFERRYLAPNVALLSRPAHTSNVRVAVVVVVAEI